MSPTTMNLPARLCARNGLTRNITPPTRLQFRIHFGLTVAAPRYTPMALVYLVIPLPEKKGALWGTCPHTL